MFYLDLQENIYEKIKNIYEKVKNQFCAPPSHAQHGRDACLQVLPSLPKAAVHNNLRLFVNQDVGKMGFRQISLNIDILYHK